MKRIETLRTLKNEIMPLIKRAAGEALQNDQSSLDALDEKVKCFCELMETCPKNDAAEAKRLMREIVSGINNINTNFETFIELSKIESGFTNAMA